VLGATHPNELRTRGEAYRLGLKAVARKNKLESNVIFYNRLCGFKGIDRVHWRGSSFFF
jgi:hypothetical protein